MVKVIKRWKINEKLKLTSASINCFPGANTRDMKHYTKLLIKKNPNFEVVIIHTCTNDLNSDSIPTEIAGNIMVLAFDIKSNVSRPCDFIISSIIPRDDQLQQETFNVSKELKELCACKIIIYTEHSNIHPRNHLNQSKLHFNF